MFIKKEWLSSFWNNMGHYSNDSVHVDDWSQDAIRQI